MAQLRDGWKKEWLRATLYDRGVQSPWAARLAGKVLWGYDARTLWASIDEISQESPGATVLDIPCGGGVAFRALSADHPLRYVAADLSSVMLGLAGRRARRYGLDGIEFLQADVSALPFPDASFDICVTYNGLHCFPDPAIALAECARVLRPGGTLRGTCVIRGESRRSDAVIALMQRAGVFGPTGTAQELTQWSAAAGLTGLRITTSGAIATFAANRSA